MTLPEIEELHNWLVTFWDNRNIIHPFFCLMSGVNLNTYYIQIPNADVNRPDVRAFKPYELQRKIRSGRVLPFKLKEGVQLEKIL